MSLSNRPFHAVIVRGGDAESAFTREMLALTLCSAEEAKRPCGECPHCKKARRGIHPDVTVVKRLYDDNGKLKRTIAVGQIREALFDAVELPNEAARRVIVIEESEKMRREAQNALLKTLEEPPEHLRFILLTDAPGALLPTVRSRCRIIDSGMPPAAPPESATELAEAFLAAARGGGARLMEFSFTLDKIDRAELPAFLDELLRAASAERRRELETGVARFPAGSLSGIIEAALECRAYLEHSVALTHISARLCGG
ncbi:MAG: hypothetical protein LBH17_05150 [Oscillospiraceae bacterium]|jgi:DNA polymerase-3 subunit delta'|nr:hypothetical protein [Oscillospiraceae bacterium]